MAVRPPDPGTKVIEVQKVSDEKQIELAKKVRYDVFVIGQGVPAEEEIDSFEDESFHFIAYYNKIPAGAARWRFTDNGVKLERFAVLEDYRSKGIGSALVEAVLKDIDQHPDSANRLRYLHSQLPALKLYRKFGFKEEGAMFQECDIDHYKMIIPT